MATEITTVTGSVLDRSLAEGIAVFIPEGLTAINPDANDFFQQVTGRAPAGAFEFAAVRSGEGQLKFLCLVDNNERKINSIDDMRSQIEEVLNAFAGKGVKSIAMNGIRCDNRDQTIRPEKYQRQFVEEYLAKHPGVFEKIILVDARGGFDR
jgi:hypothetical protein